MNLAWARGTRFATWPFTRGMNKRLSIGFAALLLAGCAGSADEASVGSDEASVGSDDEAIAGILAWFALY